ncbi:hypothetical protein LTR37_001561 [Vermiconidia calcicola]|uniref:Uncharacterized protein n=1 Tax=Vermiconidia calcicola TaxID=1690605 RepID=A0ACC3NVC9_9PEZI|nr:hypothetical protein LTR37_001561 [Vermiconidia calcicola]
MAPWFSSNATTNNDTANTKLDSVEFESSFSQAERHSQRLAYMAKYHEDYHKRPRYDARQQKQADPGAADERLSANYMPIRSQLKAQCLKEGKLEVYRGQLVQLEKLPIDHEEKKKLRQAIYDQENDCLSDMLGSKRCEARGNSNTGHSYSQLKENGQAKQSRMQMQRHDKKLNPEAAVWRKAPTLNREDASEKLMDMIKEDDEDDEEIIERGMGTMKLDGITPSPLNLDLKSTPVNVEMSPQSRIPRTHSKDANIVYEMMEQQWIKKAQAESSKKDLRAEAIAAVSNTMTVSRAVSNDEFDEMVEHKMIQITNKRREEERKKQAALQKETMNKMRVDAKKSFGDKLPILEKGEVEGISGKIKTNFEAMANSKHHEAARQVKLKRKEANVKPKEPLQPNKSTAERAVTFDKRSRRKD